MKVVCTQENLSKGLAAVGHIASKNANLPILNNILLRAHQGTIQLSATTLEIGVTRRIRGKIETEGVCTIPGKVFTDYISLLSESTLTLEQDGTTLIVKSDNGETRLHGLPADDFPLIPQLERTNGTTCPAKSIREGIAQVVFAAAADDARPEISGVLLRFVGKQLLFVATDSYRLAEKRIDCSGGVEREVSVIVPVRALQELLRVLGQEVGDVTIYLAENQILFTTEETEVVSRLIDGQYPNYEQIIPVNHETEVIVETSAFLKAVRATSLFSRPGINDLTLHLQAAGQHLTLTAANTQVGENRQDVEAKIDGKENTIVFNSRYLLDGLANLHDDTLIFQMTNNASPGVFRPQKGAEKEGGYLYLIMPIKQ